MQSSRLRLHRRDFLRAGLLAVIGGSVFRADALKIRAQQNRADVIVIGAGMAGIAAARKLVEDDFDVIILEARDRPGGRIWTDDSLGVPLDLGAAAIEGVTGNPLTRLAKEFGVKTRPFDDDTYELYDKDGKRLSEAYVNRIDKIWREIQDEIFELAAESGLDTSLQDVLDELLTEYDLNAKALRLLRWFIVTEVENLYAAELSEISLQSLDTGRDFRGGDALFPGGYREIIDGLAEGLKVNLNQKVELVEYDADKGVRVTTNRGVFEADYALVTVPLGVLKRGSISFDPPLPEEKQQAIKRLKMGTLNKVVLRFQRQFWSREVAYLGYLKEKSEPLFDIWNMEHFTDAPILLGFASGRHALSLEEMSVEQAAGELMSDLRRMLGKTISDPIDAVVTAWHSDPLAYGSYSLISKGASADDYTILAEPVDDCLFFAGEATTEDYPGEVHGAFLSGEREAARIARE
jgi:monoamine oxidase